MENGTFSDKLAQIHLICTDEHRFVQLYKDLYRFTDAQMFMPIYRYICMSKLSVDCPWSVFEAFMDIFMALKGVFKQLQQVQIVHSWSTVCF